MKANRQIYVNIMLLIVQNYISPKHSKRASQGGSTKVKL